MSEPGTTQDLNIQERGNVVIPPAVGVPRAVSTSVGIDIVRSINSFTAS